MLKHLRRKNIGDLKANRGQFLAVWLVVTLGTAFYGAIYPAGVNMLESIYRTYDQLHYMNVQAQFESADRELVNDVRALSGVQHAEGRLVIESGLQLKEGQQYLINLRLISVPDKGEQQVNRSEITDGRDIEGSNEILLLKSFADRHEIEPNDTLNVWINGTRHELRVVGLAFNAEYLVAGRSSTSPFPTPTTFGAAWMRYSELAAYADRAGEINEIVVHLRGSAGDDQTQLEDSVRRALADLLTGDEIEGLAISSRDQTASGGVVDANINGNFPLMRFYSGMFLIGSTLITGILLARLVESERQRIGTMRALGVTRHELVAHYLAFGAFIGVTGGIAGSILGYLNSFWVMHTFISYLAGGTIPGFLNTPQIPFILLGFAIVVTGSTIAGAYPAWTQSATPPGIALRPATPKTPNAISRARMGFLPAPLRWAIRNMLRAPGRALSTVLGVVAGAMMIFSAFAMWDTMHVNFGTYFDSMPFDLRVDMALDLGDYLRPRESLEEQIQRIDGVEAVQAAVVGPVNVVRGEGEAFLTVAVALDESDPFFDLQTLEGAAAFSSADGVWVGNNLQRVMGIDVGDTITLSALGEERPVEVLGVVSYAIGSPVFVPRNLLIQWMPSNVFPANTAFVRVKSGQEEAVRDAMLELPDMRAVEVTADFDADINHYLEYFRVGTIIFGGFGYILTLAVLFNTVDGSLRERREELAILRALGSTRRELWLTVTLELMTMVTIGALIGIPIGREAGFWLNGAYSTDFFGQVDTLRPTSYLIGLLSLVLIVLLAEIPGLRAAYRVDLGQVSKSQSF